ncbi:YHS domain-containing protein [Altericroceibacterium spongiae]|uniref:YHS domain-containing protein n=1 Tax=Altericroceibacterium spongiae TaxID=2320269 RepID=A0A420EPR4_9SPHN|nr:YHS domain-containing protein [Altericroceibacterium spongiae]RKF22654.1 YHS domain-containing protein [Altericroceibacterium spongiae]
MNTLLYFAFWAGLFFVMMRFGCGAHVMGHGHHGHSGNNSGPAGGWTPPTRDIDPVCGMNVETNTAKSSVYSGRVYYFCSAEHRDTFEAAPERYLGKQARALATEHRHA